ncbi:MAG TPA: hypothetical protein VIM53_00135 [Candidatus Saccharimonadales bacterium]
MHHTSSQATIVSVIVAIFAAIVVMTMAGRRKGYAGIGGQTIVRCRDGHLFTTVWIPGISFKAIRWGWMRYQRCPIDNHWTWVTPVKISELTDAERRFAAQHRDSRLP